MNVVLHNQQVTVELAGKIYVEEASELRDKLLPYTEQGYADFVIDLSRVEYIDSSGLGVLVAIQKRALSHGGGVTVRGLHGAVLELFELTRLTRVFHVEG